MICQVGGQQGRGFVKFVRGDCGFCGVEGCTRVLAAMFPSVTLRDQRCRNGRHGAKNSRGRKENDQPDAHGRALRMTRRLFRGTASTAAFRWNRILETSYATIACSGLSSLARGRVVPVLKLSHRPKVRGGCGVVPIPRQGGEPWGTQDKAEQCERRGAGRIGCDGASIWGGQA